MRALVERLQVQAVLADDGVAHVLLDRPDTSNSMSLEFLKDLHQAVMACHASADVRVVLLAGAGKNFCSGGDVKEFASRGERLPEYTREVGSWLHAVASALINLRAPVVSAVQGFAAGGGGLGLVCCSDIVVAARSAKFMSGAVRVGMAPDAGTTAILTQLVGLRYATHMLLANPTVDAEEALRVGLVTSVVDDAELLSVAGEIASGLAASAPLALAATKSLIWTAIGSSVDAHIPQEARVVAALSGTADSREGLTALIERRAARFAGR